MELTSIITYAQDNNLNRLLCIKQSVISKHALLVFNLRQILHIQDLQI